MANRTMQAKELKLRKQKRLFPKRYSAEYIPVGLPANKEVLSGYAERAKSGSIEFFMRGTTSIKEAEMRARHAMIQALWPSLCILPSGERGRNNEPRRKTLERIDEMLKDVPINQHIVLQRNPFTVTRMFWNSTLQIYFIAKVNMLEDTFQRSINYPSRSSVMHAWKRESIRWKIPIPREDSELGSIPQD